MNEPDEWLAKQYDEQEQQALKEPLAKQRIEICRSCEHYWEKLKVCSHCYCFMPAKSRITSSKCPVGKW